MKHDHVDPETVWKVFDEHGEEMDAIADCQNEEIEATGLATYRGKTVLTRRRRRILTEWLAREDADAQHGGDHAQKDDQRSEVADETVGERTIQVAVHYYRRIAVVSHAVGLQNKATGELPTKRITNLFD